MNLFVWKIILHVFIKPYMFQMLQLLGVSEAAGLQIQLCSSTTGDFQVCRLVL